MGLLEDIESDIDLGGEDASRVMSNKVDNFKGEKGVTHRVAIVSFRSVINETIRQEKVKNPALTEEEAGRLAAKVRAAVARKNGVKESDLCDEDLLDQTRLSFKLADVHYDERPGIGFVQSRVGKDGPEADRVWAHLPPAEQTISCLLLLYPTDRNGEILEGRLSKGWKIQPWKFKEGKYRDLMKMAGGLTKNRLSLASQDFTIECTDGTYQNFKFEAAGPCRWKDDPAVIKAVLKRAVTLADKMVIGKTLSTDELRQKLGLPATKAPCSATSATINTPTDADDLINQGV